MSPRWRLRARALAAGILLIAAPRVLAQAAPPSPAPPAVGRVVIPNFWDPRAAPDRVELPASRTIRFLTDDEYPPLHFAGPDGNPTGFAVELARAACERLALACVVQVRRFSTLLDALAENQGDVVAAALPLTPALRARFAATSPYFRLPARFAARLNPAAPAPDPHTLAGRAVGVVGGTAHEAYLKTFFPEAQARAYSDLALAEAALRQGEVEYVFGDGLALALWIGGTEASGCCGLVGGPYLESRYFGEGIGFVLRQDDDALRRALDEALQRLWAEGRYAELYLRFFPVSPF